MISRRTILLAGGSLLLSSSAAAQVTVRHRALHRTGRSAAHVLSVLKAHDRACDSGCQFRAPSVTKSVILDYQRRPSRYFIWSHVAAVKQVRTFQRVNIVSQAARTLFRVTSPTTGEVRALERHTKLSHEPLLDYLDILLSVEPPNSSNGSLTNVYFKAEARASGLIGMFDGVIKRSLQENARALVANIEQ